MALRIGDNFNYQGQKPNFERDSFKTLAAMKAYPETSIDEGHLSYCKEDGKRYEYKSSNDIDATTGRWREFESGGGLEEVPIATNGAVGGFKTGFTSTEKKYPVQVEEDGKAFVEVPWTDTNTTYTNMSGATSSTAGKSGLVPAPAAGAQGKYLKGDGTWNTPHDTTYNKATTKADGLMSKEDKAKLDGLTGASLLIVTQEVYDATEPKDDNTVYFIKG